jgi:hypothetical protein
MKARPGNLNTRSRSSNRLAVRDVFRSKQMSEVSNKGIIPHDDMVSPLRTNGSGRGRSIQRTESIHFCANAYCVVVFIFLNKRRETIGSCVFVDYV